MADNQNETHEALSKKLFVITTIGVCVWIAAVGIFVLEWV
jgi:hypothetical protein